MYIKRTKNDLKNNKNTVYTGKYNKFLFKSILNHSAHCYHPLVTQPSVLHQDEVIYCESVLNVSHPFIGHCDINKHTGKNTNVSTLKPIQTKTKQPEIW